MFNLNLPECNALTFPLSWPSGSYTIQGRRVRVYQPEFEECWVSGLVSQHDPISHIMEITIDKVKTVLLVELGRKLYQDLNTKTNKRYNIKQILPGMGE